jgi:hypothetical protein
MIVSVACLVLAAVASGQIQPDCYAKCMRARLDIGPELATTALTPADFCQSTAFVDELRKCLTQYCVSIVFTPNNIPERG